MWEGAELRSKVKLGGGGGEHAVKQFINIKVKSSKEEVTVHAKNELVSVAYLVHVKSMLRYSRHVQQNPLSRDFSFSVASVDMNR